MSNNNQDTNIHDLHAVFVSENDPYFVNSHLDFSQPDDDPNPVQFSLPLENQTNSSVQNLQNSKTNDSAKIKSPIKALSSAAASALPKVDKMVNGKSNHYRTLPSNTSEDDERLLQGKFYCIPYVWYF